MAHKRQSRPDSGLGYQANVLKPFKVVNFLPGDPGREVPFSIQIEEHDSQHELKNILHTN